MSADDSEIISLLQISPSKRTIEDLTRLFQHLRSIEGVVGSGPSSHRDAALREICRIARPIRAKGDTLLYRKGDPTDCWYILLTGSVLIESSMFLPRNCFGTRLNASLNRQHDCFVLEDSDLILIDYLDQEAPIPTPDIRKTSASLTDSGISENIHLPVVITSSIGDPQADPMDTLTQQLPALAPSQLSPTSPNPPRRKSSCSLDASGSSGALVSPRFPRKNLSGGNSFLTNSSHLQQQQQQQQGVSSPASNSLGDSDDDFDASSHESLRDAFWEALLKEPRDRTVEDIETLVENVQKLPAFSNLSSATRYALCSIMLVAVVREAGQVVLSDGEILDAWSVILNGTVEVADPDGTIRELTSGDSLGVRPSPETQYHRGQMITVTEDCQFVCVAQADYVEIMARVEGQAEIPEVGEGGRVVLVYENTDTSSLSQAHLPTGTKTTTVAAAATATGARVVVKGTPEKLIEHLMADMSPADSNYPEDFLLTYRTFLDSPLPITSRLLQWYHSDRSLRSRVKRYVLLWVHNHFNDFDDRPAMLHFLNKFDDLLVKDGTAGERRLFHLACSTKAVSRDVEVAFLLVPRGASLPSSSTSPRSPPGLATTSLSIIFPFVLVGGTRDFGVFISQFDDTCKLPMSSSAPISSTAQQEGYSSASVQACTNGAAIAPFSSAAAASTPNSPSNSATTTTTTTTTTTSSSSSSSTSPGDGHRSFLPCCQLRRGDQILAVNRRSVEGLSRSRIAKLIASLSAEASTTAMLVSLPGLIASGGESGDLAEGNLVPGLPNKHRMGLVARLTLTVIYNPLHFFELLSNLPNPRCQSNLKATVVSTCGEQTSAFEAACFRDGLKTLATASPTRTQVPAYKSAVGDDAVDIPRSALTRPSPPAGYRLQASAHRLIPLLNQELRSKEFFVNTSSSQVQSVAAQSSGLCASMRSGYLLNANIVPGSTDLASTRQALNMCAISSLGLIDLPTRAVGRALLSSGKRGTPTTARGVVNGLGTPSVGSVDRGGPPSLSKSSSQPDLALALALEAAQRQPPQRQQQRQFDLLFGPRLAGGPSGGVGRRAVSLTAPLAADPNGVNNSPLQVIRVWRAGGDGGREQSSKLVPIRKHTTALEATHLAAEEFGVPEDDRESYCLCQVTVDEGPVIKQSRIGDQVDDLTSRTALNSRFYLKHNKKSDALVSDDVAKSIYLDSRVSFLQLSPEILSIQLTVDDYSVFRSVEATEYVDKVFNLYLPSVVESSRANNGLSVGATGSSATGSASSGYSSEPDSTSLGQESIVGGSGFATGFGNLDQFAEIVNKEAYWVPNEICAEQTLSKRVDSLKRFIKMAKLCRDLRNYNTMFCILVGLHMAPVERLRQTWERLPNKYVKLCRDLALVLDPSRNFFHYRNLLTAEGPHAPLIPYLPLVLKDLTFIHLGNPSRYADNLVNFAKLRMIAKEIRALRRMSTVDYDLPLAQRLIQIGQSSGVRGVAAGVLSGLAGLAVDSGLGSGISKTAGGASSESPGKSGLQKRPRDPSSNPASTATVAPSVNAGVSSTLVGAYASGDKQRSTSPSLLTAGGESLPSAATTSTSLWSGVMSQQLQNRRRSGSLSLKKIYDTWLMGLRVRTYLSNLNVSDDLEVLSQMSLRIEPGPRGVATETATTTAKTTPASLQPQSSSASTNSTQATEEHKAGVKGEVGRTPVDRVPSTNSASSSVCSDTKNTDSRPADSDSSKQPVCAGSQLSPRRVPIFGAQSLEDTRRLLALSEYNHRRSHRMPQVLLPTNAPISSQLAAEYAMAAAAAAARLNGGCSIQQQRLPHHNHHHHHNPPSYHPMYQSHGLGLPGSHQMQPGRDGLPPSSQAAVMHRRNSVSSCSSTALNNMSALVPTTARLPPSACHHSHQHPCPHHGHPSLQQQQQMWSRQRVCLRPSCSLDYPGSSSSPPPPPPPPPPPHLSQQKQMMLGTVPPTAHNPLNRGRAQSTRVPSQQGAWLGGGAGCPLRSQQQLSRPSVEGEVSGAQRPPGPHQPSDSSASFQPSQQLLQNVPQFQNRCGKPQPPPYEYALAIRQQQQQQQKTSSSVPDAMKSQCPRSEPPCPKPPPHQMLPDSDQLRPATAIRSSSGHPPGAPLPQQYVSASAASSHIQGGSPYPRQQASVQRPMRPPLPSYNQALAMKQQQMPFSAFPVMSGAHESPQSTHMLPNANSGISSRDLKPS